jgi:membrane peptidoglycan carboxypeptidase
MLSALILTGGLIYADLTRGLPPPQTLEVLLNAKNGQLMQPTRIYDRGGEHLLLMLENPGLPRTYLPVDESADGHISPLLVKMILWQDDPAFREHPGASFVSPLDPAPQTIAEGLVDRLLLSREESGWRRALRMRLLALQVTSMYGREKVLEWHLNSVYFGHMAFGADAAARLYFEKSAADLSLAEAALLAEIKRAPALNPLDAPAVAGELKENSLNRLLLSGIVAPEEYLSASGEEIYLRTSMAAPASEAPAFTKYLLTQLDEIIGRERLEQGGLRVISSLDYDLQSNLLCTLTVQMQRLTEQEPVRGAECQAASLLPTLPPAQEPFPASMQAGGILLDPQNGEILALVGKMDLSGDSDIVSGMHTGSILTPLAALNAFTRGMSPATLVWDTPSSLPDELAEYRQEDEDYRGPMRLRTALGNDILTPLTSLLLFLGPQDVLRQAEPLGLSGLDAADIQPDFFYQGVETSLIQIAQVYSAFAGLGRINGLAQGHSGMVQPAAVVSVSDASGQLFWDGEIREFREVVSPALAYLIHDILKDENTRRLSLGYPNALEIGRPAGAKTAAAAGGREIWTAGYTPQRLAVIWMGLPADAETKQTLDSRATSGVWHALMQFMLRSLPVKGWSVPTGISQVDVCDPSGLLPSVDCPATVKEIFLSGSEPTQVDTLYKKIAVNRETGRIATVFTPPEMVEERVFINYPQEARTWALAVGKAAAPEDYDIIQAPPPVDGVDISHPPAFAYVHGLVEIIGTASGEGFYTYSLQVGEGLNPAAWQQIGEESRRRVEGGLLGLWDTRELNGLYAIRLMMVREDKKVFSAIVQVSVDNVPPTLNIPYPADGQVFKTGPAPVITFQAEATDLIGIKKVEWIVDGQLAGERLQPPFSLPWTGTPGDHVLTVRTYDLAGNVAEAGPVKFSIE